MNENETLIDINFDVVQCADVFDMHIKPIPVILIYTNHNRS